MYLNFPLRRLSLPHLHVECILFSCDCQGEYVAYSFDSTFCTKVRWLICSFIPDLKP